MVPKYNYNVHNRPSRDFKNSIDDAIHYLSCWIDEDEKEDN